MKKTNHKMKIYFQLKEIIEENESDSWQKINKILVYAILFNSVIFIFLSIALIAKPEKNTHLQSLNSEFTSQSMDIFFNIGGRLFNISRQILENNRECKLYYFYLSQKNSSGKEIQVLI